MLEHSELRLLPWTWSRLDSASPLSGWLRVVEAAGSAEELGSVRLVRGSTWLGCGPRRLEVCETEDAALLMTLEHGWFGFGNWQVLDAERRRVGALVGAHVLEDQGSRFATVWHDGETRLTVRRTNGAVCAHIESRSDGTTLVRFPEDVPANPFLRMVLLGTCILQSPAPPRDAVRDRETSRG